MKNDQKHQRNKRTRKTGKMYIDYTPLTLHRSRYFTIGVNDIDSLLEICDEYPDAEVVLDDGHNLVIAI